MKLSTILELVKIVTNAMNNPKNQAEQWPTLLNGGTSGLSLIGSFDQANRQLRAVRETSASTCLVD